MTLSRARLRRPPTFVDIASRGPGVGDVAWTVVPGRSTACRCRRCGMKSGSKSRRRNAASSLSLAGDAGGPRVVLPHRPGQLRDHTASVLRLAAVWRRGVTCCPRPVRRRHAAHGSFVYGAVVVALWRLRPDRRILVALGYAVERRRRWPWRWACWCRAGVFRTDIGSMVTDDKAILPWGLLVGFYSHSNTLGQSLALGLPWSCSFPSARFGQFWRLCLRPAVERLAHLVDRRPLSPGAGSDVVLPERCEACGGDGDDRGNYAASPSRCWSTIPPPSAREASSGSPRERHSKSRPGSAAAPTGSRSSAARPSGSAPRSAARTANCCTCW